MTTTIAAKNISASLSLGIFMLATTVLAPVDATAKNKGPVLDPNAELTDQKLNPTIAKQLSDAILSYNAGKYSDAEEKIDQAREVPSPTRYDSFQIENLNAVVEHAEGIVTPRCGPMKQWRPTTLRSNPIVRRSTRIVSHLMQFKRNFGERYSMGDCRNACIS